jgi:hypothetical protein
MAGMNSGAKQSMYIYIYPPLYGPGFLIQGERRKGEGGGTGGWRGEPQGPCICMSTCCDVFLLRLCALLLRVT